MLRNVGCGICGRLTIVLILACAPQLIAQETYPLLGQWELPSGGEVAAVLDQVNGTDLTQGGASNALELKITPSEKAYPTVTVSSGPDQASSWTRTDSLLSVGDTFVIPLTDFIPLAGTGADLRHARSITVRMSDKGVSGEQEYTVMMKSGSTLHAAKTVVSFDMDSDGQVSPGDVLEYTITITNSGTLNATSVVFSDTPGAHSSLVAGSVTTTSGTVFSGNTAGNTTVQVNIPTVGVPPCTPSSVTIRFRATIASPFTADPPKVCNQGMVTSSGNPNIWTDDPTTVAAQDSTCTTVVVAPEGEGEPPCLEVLHYVDFEAGIPPSYSLYNIDGLVPASAVSYVTSAWVAALESTGPDNWAATSTSFYNPSGRADDWIVTPQIALSSQATLSWRARAADATQADGYSVYVSITGNTPAILQVNAPVFATAAESAAWTRHSVDLGAAGYGGKSVYIAWRNNSNNKYLLYLDDVKVCNNAAGTAPSCPPGSVFSQRPDRVSGAYRYAVSDNVRQTITDNFSGATQPITQVSWWGFFRNLATGDPCMNTPQQFRVEFLADSGGVPGASVALFDGVATMTPTGRTLTFPPDPQYYSEYSFRYAVNSPVMLTSGWLRVEALGVGACSFGWVQSPDGDSKSSEYNFSTGLQTSRVDDFAFCLTSGAVPTDTGTVLCTVIDSQSSVPVLNASVSVDAASVNPVTENVNGVYKLSNVPVGLRTITAQASGYTTASTSVTVTTGETVPVSLSLASSGGCGCGGKKSDFSLKSGGSDLLLGALALLSMMGLSGMGRRPKP